MALNLFTAGGPELPSSGKAGCALIKSNNDDNTCEWSGGIQNFSISCNAGSQAVHAWIASQIVEKLKTEKSGFKFITVNNNGQIWHCIAMVDVDGGNKSIYGTILIFSYAVSGFYKYIITNNSLSSSKYYS